ncbi:ribokinase [Sporosarcina aquimarina]|uniref:ribokinase n=1 Tax=Sporosarcina aquimarina TaxID=114975 RepID=UPI001C8EA17E|nr:ribokinase [Sporosarcina aquimarina]MBY0221569.1 ribokinase [Sporosarcina aquimarina]
MANVIVIGSYVTDLMTLTPHLPKPGETVLGGPFQMGPGGKGANQATAAVRSGSHVTYMTKLGTDIFGEQALQYFKDEGMNIDCIKRDPTEITGTAQIIVDQHSENSIAVALGACGKITKEDVYATEEKFKGSDIALVQFETSMEAIQTTIELASKHHVPLILNPAPYRDFPKELLTKVSYITPNEIEASELSGIKVIDELSARKAAERIYEMGIPHIIITMGKQGVYLYTGEGTGELIPAFSVHAIDTTGAGDAFSGGLAHSLAAGKELKESIRYANAVAALCVTKLGTAPAMPHKEQVEHFLRESGEVKSDSYS